ncbi:hypothetical protein THAOC_27423, partial [Thalassiosira oceanica]
MPTGLSMSATMAVKAEEYPIQVDEETHNNHSTNSREVSNLNHHDCSTSEALMGAASRPSPPILKWRPAGDGGPNLTESRSWEGWGDEAMKKEVREKFGDRLELKCSSAVGVWEPDCGVRCASFNQVSTKDRLPAVIRHAGAWRRWRWPDGLSLLMICTVTALFAIGVMMALGYSSNARAGDTAGDSADEDVARNEDVVEESQGDIVTAEEDDMDTCANCGKRGSDTVTLKKCNACHLVKYCGVDCQKAHRKEHKK